MWYQLVASRNSRYQFEWRKWWCSMGPDGVSTCYPPFNIVFFVFWAAWNPTPTGPSDSPGVERSPRRLLESDLGRRGRAGDLPGAGFAPGASSLEVCPRLWRIMDFSKQITIHPDSQKEIANRWGYWIQTFVLSRILKESNKNSSRKPWKLGKCFFVFPPFFGR